MPELILVYTLCPSMAEAESIAKTVLADRLIACANIGAEAVSHFVWQGETQRAVEIPVILKTTADKYAALEKRLLELHSYDVPCITAIGTEQVLPAYMDWVEESVA